jgi:phosphoglycerol transferase MdoB-like AlkP superfamily enzyme
MTFTVQDEGNTILPNVGDHLSKDTNRMYSHTHTQPQVPHMTTESILLAFRTVL